MIEQEKNEFIYDVRLVERHIAEGKIARKDYEAYLRALESVEENSETISSRALFDLPEEPDDCGANSADAK
ncbi:MAG TPA: hypothetical protein PK961_02340 [bacterium]|nr:hypothetical protein [bacterium]